jgi:hypothetical protein
MRQLWLRNRMCFPPPLVPPSVQLSHSGLERSFTLADLLRLTLWGLSIHQAAVASLGYALSTPPRLFRPQERRALPFSKF